jgi:hypothetical protein
VRLSSWAWGWLSAGQSETGHSSSGARSGSANHGNLLWPERARSGNGDRTTQGDNSGQGQDAERRPHRRSMRLPRDRRRRVAPVRMGSGFGIQNRVQDFA